MHLPTSQQSRINEIDAIRAIALFGILMMNIMSFAGSYIDISEDTSIYSGVWNERALWFINSFVTSSFFTMFSFLFGLSFYLFISRAEKKVDNPNKLFVRRLVVLLIIGVLHGVFIWYGDILTLYAITGFWLILFVRVKPIVNLIVPIVIFSAGTLLVLGLAVLMRGFEVEEDNAGLFNFNLTEIMHNGNYMDLVGANGVLFMWGLAGIVVMMPIVLAMFLLGLHVGQRNLHNTFKLHIKKILVFGIIALAIGIPIKLYTGHALTYSTDFVSDTLSGLSYTIGGPLVALGYLSIFIVVLHYIPALVRFLQPAGQMALTNYLMQSIFMVAFFKVTNLYDQMDAVYFVPFSLAFFIVQVLLSHVWMKYFKFGPFEWIWRMLTYMQVVPLRRQNER